MTESPFSISQILMSLQTTCDEREFGPALLYLRQIFFGTKKSYFMSDSQFYNESLIEDLFIHLIPIAEYSNARLHKELDLYLKHFLSIAISFCPNFMINLIPKMITTIQKPVMYQYLTTSYANLLMDFRYEKQVLRLPKLKEMVFASQPQYLVNIPDSIWLLFLNNQTEEEIIDLVLLLSQSNNAHAVHLLMLKNVERILPLFVMAAPLKLVNQVLKIENKTKFDIIPLIVRLVDVLADEQPIQINHSLSILKKIVRFVDESNLEALRPILKTITRKLSENQDFPLKAHYLSAIVKCEQYNLIKCEEIIPFISFYNPQCLKDILRLCIHHIDKDEFKLKIFDYMIEITSNREYRSMSYLLSIYISKSNIIREIDPQKYQSVYNRIFLPINTLTKTAASTPTTKEITNEKKEKLLNKIIDLILLNNDRCKMESIVYDLIEAGNSYEYLTKLKRAVKDQMNIRIDPSKLDWFGETSHQSFMFIEDVDVSFYNEFLSYQLIKPKNIDIILASLCSHAEKAGPLVFMSVLSLLKSAIDIMGYGNRWLNINTTFDNTVWFDEETLKHYFSQLDTTISNSYFGKALEKIVDSVITLKEHVSLTDSVVLFLICASRYLSHSIPKCGYKLLESTYGDFKSGRIPFSKDSEKIFNQHMEVYFKAEPPFLDSPDFVRVYIKVFGTQKLLTDKKAYLIDAISKDPELAVQFQEIINQPLPPMRTFKCFTAEKHQEWCNKIEKQIPEIFWILPHSNVNDDGNNNNENTNNVRGDDQDTQKFVFIPNLEIPKGPKIHEYEQPTKFGVISYLWHSNNSSLVLSKESQLQELTSFALDNADDARIALGYLTFALRNNINIDVSQWIPKIHLSNTSYISIYAATILLQNVKRGDVTEEVNNFANKCLDFIGIYDHSPTNIASAFETVQGFQWQLVRAVIGLDFEKYKNLSSLLIVTEFSDIADVSNTIAQCLHILSESPLPLTLAQFAGALTNVFLFNRNSMYLHTNFMLPTNFPHDQRLLDFINLNELQPPLSLGRGILDSLISILRGTNSAIKIPSIFECFILNIANTSNQYQTVTDLLHERAGTTPDHIRNIIIHMNDFLDHENVIAKFLVFKPPSYFRAFYRALSKDLKPWLASSSVERQLEICYKRRDNIARILKKQDGIFNEKVFPEFCYEGMPRVGMKTYRRRATKFTSLKLGFYALKIIMGAYTEMMEPNMETAFIIKPLSLLNEGDFLFSNAWPDYKSAKHDFISMLIDTVLSEKAYLCTSDEILKALYQSFSIKEIAEVVLEKNFFNNKMKKSNAKFSAVLLLFRRLKNMAIQTGDEELVQKFAVYHKQSNKEFENDELNIALANPNSEKSIEFSLRYASLASQSSNDVVRTQSKSDLSQTSDTESSEQQFQQQQH